MQQALRRLFFAAYLSFPHIVPISHGRSQATFTNYRDDDNHLELSALPTNLFPPAPLTELLNDLQVGMRLE